MPLETSTCARAFCFSACTKVAYYCSPKVTLANRAVGRNWTIRRYRKVTFATAIPHGGPWLVPRPVHRFVGVKDTYRKQNGRVGSAVSARYFLISYLCPIA